MNPRLLLSLVPIVVFFGLTKAGPAWVAITGGFMASSLVFYTSRRERLIGFLTAYGFGILAVTALVGIAWNSEKAYLASGPVSDFLFVPLYLGSIYLQKPLVGGIARELLPAIAGRVPINASIYAWLSVMWAGYDLVHGALRVFLLERLSVGEYIVWSRLVAWPVTGTLLVLTFLVIYREARRRSSARLTRAP
jgi:hypothetical protein